jgi:hypothetical protein
MTQWILVSSSCRAALLAGAALTFGCGDVPTGESVAEDSNEIIYGTENREEFGAFDTEERRLARSVAALFPSTAVTCNAATCTLTTSPFTQANVGTTAAPDVQPL